MNPKCVCGKNAYIVCSKCEIKQYCKRKCQNKDWKNHKLICETSKEKIEMLMGEFIKSININSMNLFNQALTQEQRGCFCM